ncbi:CC-NBS-LRR resistance protein, partial [Trifolium medium]|nr:CC-NBS-LRR resistance protein [Trifolium medium]
ITLDSINEVLDDAETKQYHDRNVKTWLDDLNHEVYEVDQLLDVIAADAQPKGNMQRFLSCFINRGFEARIEALIHKIEFLAEKKDRLGLQASNEGGVTRKILPAAFWVDDDYVIYGREHEKEEIIEFLLSDCDGANQVILEKLLFPFNHGSSQGKIIVTTHDKEVASIMRSTRLLDLKQLEESDCWSLFVSRAFHDRIASQYSSLEIIGKKVVDKCGGSPLALTEMGNLLRTKFSKREWVQIMETDL